MTPPKRWLEAEVTVSQERADAVEAAWEAAGADAVTFLPAADTPPVVEPAPAATPLWTELTVRGLFSDCEGAAAEALAAQLSAELQTGEQASFCTRFLADQAWERAWLKHFEPAWFGSNQNLCICPWHQEVDGDAVLRMDPGLAFGTGSHATTSLCLDALADSNLAGKRVLDVGCGSGILSLAAALLGAAAVVGVDNDPQALAASSENARRNKLPLTVHSTVAQAQGPFDLIVANIVSGVLLELAPAVISAAQAETRLLLSGLLDGQARAVEEAYGAHFGPFQRTSRDGWLLLDAGLEGTVS
ncbi:MAG: 50S ribosomal protein L11 methyltransferase [Pseudomonadota bacterium]